jgi:lysophospholipase L1-like esterase
MAVQIGTTGDDRFEALAADDAVDGGTGFDSISYAASSARVWVDLAAGEAVALGAPPEVPVRVMPLGDSLTRGGVTSRDPVYGLGDGYRTELWKTFQAEGAAVGFVGSATAGPGDLGDTDHEGHGGRTIDWLSARVEGWLDAAEPDAVLLMAGTNDVRANPTRPADPPEVMAREMAALIDRVALGEDAPAVFVATLPPIDPSGNGERAAAGAEEYDALLAAVVAERQARGLDVTLVDMNARLDLGDVSDPPADSGVHLTPGG